MILPAILQLSVLFAADAAVELPQWANTFIDDFSKAAEDYVKDHSSETENGFEMNKFYSTVTAANGNLMQHMKNSGELDAAAKVVTGILTAGAANMKHQAGTTNPWAIVKDVVPKMVNAGPVPAKIGGLLALAAVNYTLRDKFKDMIFNTIGEKAREQNKEKIQVKYDEQNQGMRVSTLEVADGEVATKLSKMGEVQVPAMVDQLRKVLPQGTFPDAKLTAATKDMFRKAGEVNLAMTNTQFRRALFDTKVIVPILANDLD